MTLLKKHVYIVILVLVSSLLAILNYTPNTWLSGWDTLHPEFNFPLNIQRLLSGVFRVEQGLGAVAAHSHMADLPRVLLLYLTSFIIPPELIRYFYVFLNLIAGPLGMYLFLKKFVLKNKLASFLGALFYLLNLGTVQIFNVPFEMFTTLYATLPFVFYFATKYLTEEQNREKNLLFFAITVIFTAPSAYAATLWYAFFACFSLYVIAFSMLNRGVTRGKGPDSAEDFKRSLTGMSTGGRELEAGPRKILIRALSLIGITVILNLFWIFPNIYFVLNHAAEVQNANINLLFSENAFLKNKEFGDLGSLFFLKTFYFDWSIYNGINFVNLLNPFIEHLKDIKVQVIGIVLGILWVAGLILGLSRNKKTFLPLLIPFLLSLFFLINSNFPTGVLFDSLQTNFPFFKEALRFPQNKFLNLYVFFVSIFFGFFCLFLIEKLKSRKKEILITIALSSTLIFYALPSFEGNLINKYVRVKIPQSYFAVFEYFNKEPSNLRVSNLPIHSQWGWVYYKWGFQGAGFLYFGIKQPLLDRDFDRWSNYNESYYREASYAIYKKDAKLLTSVLNKYNIGYILLDRNVFEPSKPESILFFEQSEELLNDTGLIIDQKTFGNIKVFKLKNHEKELAKISVSQNVSPAPKSIYNDYAYSLFGNYITSDNASTYFPFRNFVDNQSRLIATNVKLEPDRIKFSLGQKLTIDGSSFSNAKNPQAANLILEKTRSAGSGQGRESINLSFYPASSVFDNTPIDVPLKAILPLSGQFISVNQSQLFDLNKLAENTPVLAGKVILESSQNQISSFDNGKAETIENVSSIINPFFESCEGSAPPKAEIFGNKIKIEAVGSVCVIIPYGFFPSENRELLTNFGFEYKGTANIKSCLFDQSSSSCTYYKDPSLESSQNINLISFLHILQRESSSHTAIKLFFEKDADATNNIELSNFFASFTKASETRELPNYESGSQKISFENIFLPRNPLNSTEAVFQNKFENDCKNQNNNSRKEILQTQGSPLVKYSSTLGSFCDHFAYPNLPHDIGYLVLIKSKNEKGLPLTLCITNYTSRRCEIYTELHKNKELDEDVFVLPPTDKDAIGYDVNFENTAVGSTAAVNYIASIEFIPIPYGGLASINIGTENRIESNVLVSNTAFEKGFKAYEINSQWSIANGLFPFIFGNELKEHVLVNNWANGWILDKSNIKNEISKIKVVFWPQYLEYLGLILVIAVLSILAIKFLTSKS